MPLYTGVPGGNVNILGGHIIDHSKKNVYVRGYMCPILNGFRDRAILLYSSLDLAPNIVLPSFPYVNRCEASVGRCDW
jgi:hypothetical protein